MTYTKSVKLMFDAPLTHQVLAMCSERLPSELDITQFSPQTNGYLKHGIKSFMANSMKQFLHSA